MFRKIAKKLRRKIYRLVCAVYDSNLKPPTGREKQLVEELKASFRESPSVAPGDSYPSEKEWLGNVNRLKELVLNDDPREFLRWDVIFKTMSVTYAEYVTPELKCLKSRVDWSNRWRQAIEESSVGHPVPHWQYPRSSANLIHHAYHLDQFEEKTMLQVHTMDFVFEFGGGYGSMCRLFHNLGFQGKYVLFDLSDFSSLQKFYLKSIGLAVHPLKSFEKEKKGCVCISGTEQLRHILSNSHAGNSMFIATWSISEAPIEFRNNILPLTADFGAFLIAYQHRFKEVDNITFFRNWAANQKDIECYDWEIEHIPKNRYLMGKRKGNQ